MDHNGQIENDSVSGYQLQIFQILWNRGDLLLRRKYDRWLEEKSEKGRHIKSRQVTLTGLFPGCSSPSGPANLARNPGDL